MTSVKRRLAVLAILLAAAVPANAGTASAHGNWVGTWSTGMQPMHAEPWMGETWAPGGFTDQSVRQVVRISAGGTSVRIRLSNVYGETPLRLAGASIGKAESGGSVRPGTLRPLLFSHRPTAVIPAGRELVSDATVLPVKSLEQLSITLYFAKPTGPATFHTFASAPAYRASGDHRFTSDATPFTETTTSFYYLSGVDVSGGPDARRGTVVAYGDSITDGVGSTIGANNRYPDELAERLVASGRAMGVLNAGIGGNRVLRDSACFGEAAAARFERDALNRPNVRTVVVLDGINDIIDSRCTADTDPRPAVTAAELIEGYRWMIRSAHARNVRIVGATITQFKGFFLYTPEREAVRDAVNDWIRTSGEFDAVADFDRALADPADQDKMRADYLSDDFIHPNDAGYQVMAATIDPRTL
jgi:lysophospholipase L1-like esterase